MKVEGPQNSTVQGSTTQLHSPTVQHALARCSRLLGFWRPLCRRASLTTRRTSPILGQWRPSSRGTACEPSPRDTLAQSPRTWCGIRRLFEAQDLVPRAKSQKSSVQGRGLRVGGRGSRIEVSIVQSPSRFLIQKFPANSSRWSIPL